MRFPSKFKPALALRVGLGLVFIYAGIMSFSAPENWIGFVPRWVGNIIEPAIFLQIHAGFEIVLGLALLAGLFLPIASILAFLSLFSILLFYGVDDVTFRDFGLLMAALALFLIAVNRDERQ